MFLGCIVWNHGRSSHCNPIILLQELLQRLYKLMCNNLREDLVKRIIKR